MIELASSINKAMPKYVVERAAVLVGQKIDSLKKAPVLVLGAAYKKNVDDVRESPALEVMHLLLKKGASVSYSDPFVPSLSIAGKKLRSQALTPALVKKNRCVIILTDHSAFNYAMVVRQAKRVLDTRNVLRKFKPTGNVSFL